MNVRIGAVAFAVTALLTESPFSALCASALAPAAVAAMPGTWYWLRPLLWLFCQNWITYSEWDAIRGWVVIYRQVGHIRFTTYNELYHQLYPE